MTQGCSPFSLRSRVGDEVELNFLVQFIRQLVKGGKNSLEIVWRADEFFYFCTPETDGTGQG
ncbi:hypothetical protein D3C87_1649120 [compost metagenome]